MNKPRILIILSIFIIFLLIIPSSFAMNQDSIDLESDISDNDKLYSDINHINSNNNGHSYSNDLENHGLLDDNSKKDELNKFNLKDSKRTDLEKSKMNKNYLNKSDGNNYLNEPNVKNNNLNDIDLVEEHSIEATFSNKIYVSISGNDDEGNGTYENPFKSIEKAVEYANSTKDNCTIYVSNGTYLFYSYIENAYNLNIIGLDEVVFDLNNKPFGFNLKGQVYISNIKFINANGALSSTYAPVKMSSSSGESLTIINSSFIDCKGYWAGGISTYYGGNAILKVANTSFINCRGSDSGAIAVSYANKADISFCSFINCTGERYAGAIVLYNNDSSLPQSNINYCNFINNWAANGVSDVFTRKSENLDYNFWGDNNRPNKTKVSNSSSINHWTILKTYADISKVSIDDILDLSFDFTKSTDGLLESDLNNPMPDLDIYLSADLGSFDKDIVITENGHADAIYTPHNTGGETLVISSPDVIEKLKFDIIGDELTVIYVASNGSDNGRGIEDSPYKTIEHALSQVTDVRNTIFIKKGIYYESNLLINKSVRIIGENKYETIIDASNRDRIFIISLDENSQDYEFNVSIKTITLINGSANCSKDKINMDLHENGAYEGILCYGMGGAIFVDSGNLILNNTIISDSKSVSGGAVAIVAEDKGSLTIFNSSFISNNLEENENFPSNDQDNNENFPSNDQDNNENFPSNDQNNNENFRSLGGAIYTNSYLNISDSLFENNTASTSDGRGAGIFIANIAIITNSCFIGNNAKLNGGAIFINTLTGTDNLNEYHILEDNSIIILKNNTFKTNNASVGSAIFSNSNLTNIFNNIFEENNALCDATVFLDSSSGSSLKNNCFTNNSADLGAVIYLNNSKAILSNNSMTNNTGIENSNFIYTNNSYLNANLRFLDNNTLTVKINSYANLYAKLTDDMENPIANAKINFTLDGKDIGFSISDNQGIASLTYLANDSLASYILSGSFDKSNDEYPSTIKTAILKQSKFYWFIEDAGYFTLQDAVDASEEGDTVIGLGGIYSYDEIRIGNRMERIYKNITIKAQNLGDIILTSDSGRVFDIAYQFYGDPNHRPSQLILKNIIIENASDDYGGAIYNDGYLILENCIFRNNHGTNAETGSKWHGGAIMNWRSMIINNCTFINNTAGSGGAINTESLIGDVRIADSTFIDNNASLSTGGAIYSADYKGISISNCSFINNYAAYGGAVYAFKNMTLEDCIFTNNGASYAGGTIYSRNFLKLNNVSMENSSSDYGGNLFLIPSITNNYIESGTDSIVETIVETYNITNSKFKNSHARIAGGTIYAGNLYVSTGFIENCSFINSSSLGDGGVIVNSISNCTVKNSEFINISSLKGGAFFNSGLEDLYDSTIFAANLFIFDCRFENSYSESDGGVIYNENNCSNIILENSHFSNSKSGEYGGVIYNNGYLTLNNNSMLNSSAYSAQEIFNNYLIDKAFIILLNNETIEYSLNPDPEFNFSLRLTDDRGNTISGGNIMLYLNNHRISDEIQVRDGEANYKYALGLGKYLASATYDGVLDSNYTVKTGIVSTYRPKGTQISIDADDLFVDDNVIISFKDENNESLVNCSISISLTSDSILERIHINNQNFDTNDTVLQLIGLTNENGEIIISSLTAAEYNISCQFEGNRNLTSSSISKEFNVSKYPTDISLNIIKNDLTINLTSRGAGLTNKEIIISILKYADEYLFEEESNRTIIEPTDLNGLIKISLEKGNFLINAQYNGDNVFINSSDSLNSSVYPINTRISIEVPVVYVNEEFNVNVSLFDDNNEGLNSSLIIIFNGKEYSLDIEKGRGSNVLDPITFADFYPLCIFYLGDSTHDANTFLADVEIKGKVIDNSSEGNNSGDNSTGGNGSGDNSTGSNSSSDNGTATDKNIRTATDLQRLIDSAEEGSIIDLSDCCYTNISNISITKDITISGNNATIVSAGDGNPLFILKSNNLTIRNIEFKLNNGDCVVLTIASNATDPLAILVPQIDIYDNLFLTNDDAVAESITILELASSRGILNTNNPISIHDNIVASGIKPFKFTVNNFLTDNNLEIPKGGEIQERLPSIIHFKDMVTYAIDQKIDGRTGKYFEVNLTDKNGNPLENKLVQIGFNGAIYNRTSNATGGVKLQINLGYKGTYTFAVSFLGDDKYNGSFAVAKITVNPQMAKLTSQNKSFKANAKTKSVSASFKTVAGNPIANKKITFTINGKTYSAKTDSKGLATVNVSLSKKGTYSFTAKYAGDNKYAAISSNAKLTIK